MKKVLMVIDMQNDFIDGALGTDAARRVVPAVADKLRDFDGDIILTQDTHDSETYLGTQEGRRLPVLHCVKDTDGWRINPAIEKAAADKGAKVIRIRKSAFASDDIVPLVNSYDEIHICGVCTDICVVSNAMVLKSFFTEKPIYVDASCCAGTTPEMHQKALAVMGSCQIIIENN